MKRKVEIVFVPFTPEDLTALFEKRAQAAASVAAFATQQVYGDQRGTRRAT